MLSGELATYLGGRHVELKVYPFSFRETLYNYIRYSQEACLLHLVPREDLIGKELLSFQEKIYLTDHGIRHMNIRRFLLSIE